MNPNTWREWKEKKTFDINMKQLVNPEGGELSDRS